MTLKEFDSTINTDGFTLVDFWAPWCGPCKVIGPIIERLIESNPDLKVLKVGVDDSVELTNRFEIRSIPALLLLNGEKTIASKIGVSNQDQIQSWLNENMSL